MQIFQNGKLVRLLLWVCYVTSDCIVLTNWSGRVVVESFVFFHVVIQLSL